MPYPRSIGNRQECGITIIRLPKRGGRVDHVGVTADDNRVLLCIRVNDSFTRSISRRHDRLISREYIDNMCYSVPKHVILAVYGDLWGSKLCVTVNKQPILVGSGNRTGQV